MQHPKNPCLSGLCAHIENPKFPLQPKTPETSPTAPTPPSPTPQRRNNAVLEPTRLVLRGSASESPPPPNPQRPNTSPLPAYPRARARPTIRPHTARSLQPGTRPHQAAHQAIHALPRGGNLPRALGASHASDLPAEAQGGVSKVLLAQQCTSAGDPAERCNGGAGGIEPCDVECWRVCHDDGRRRNVGDGY